MTHRHSSLHTTSVKSFNFNIRFHYFPFNSQRTPLKTIGFECVPLMPPFDLFPRSPNTERWMFLFFWSVNTFVSFTHSVGQYILQFTFIQRMQKSATARHFDGEMVKAMRCNDKDSNQTSSSTRRSLFTENRYFVGHFLLQLHRCCVRLMADKCQCDFKRLI